MISQPGLGFSPQLLQSTMMFSKGTSDPVELLKETLYRWSRQSLLATPSTLSLSDLSQQFLLFPLVAVNSVVHYAQMN